MAKNTTKKKLRGKNLREVSVEFWAISPKSIVETPFNPPQKNKL